MLMHMAEEPVDQAAGLRRMARSRPVKVIAVASGKGGTGKTLVATSLYLSLKERYIVKLLDFDFE